MNTRNMETRDVRDDKYARESFGWRRMKGWQIWAIVVGAAALVIIAFMARY